MMRRRWRLEGSPNARRKAENKQDALKEIKGKILIER